MYPPSSPVPPPPPSGPPPPAVPVAYYVPVPVAPQQQQQQEQGSSGLGVAGLVLGIIALVFAFIPCLNVLSLIMGGIGLLLSFFGLFARRKGMAFAGLLLCMAALAVTVKVNDMLFGFGDRGSKPANSAVWSAEME